MDALIQFVDTIGPSSLSSIAKLLAAFILGGLIGLERESKGNQLVLKLVSLLLLPVVY